MKPSSKSNLKNQPSIADDSFIATKINESFMKKLANTSPFLLLLLPVFMMIILTLTVNTNQNNNGEMVVKPAKTPASIVKTIFK